MSIVMQLGLSFHVEGLGNADELAESAQKVMEELLELERCNPELSDSSVAMDASTMTVEVELVTTGESEPECVERAVGAVRTAIHAAGHGTPGWSIPPKAEPSLVVDLGKPEGSAGKFRRLHFTASIE